MGGCEEEGEENLAQTCTQKFTWEFRDVRRLNIRRGTLPNR